MSRVSTKCARRSQISRMNCISNTASVIPPTIRIGMVVFAVRNQSRTRNARQRPRWVLRETAELTVLRCSKRGTDGAVVTQPTFNLTMTKKPLSIQCRNCDCGVHRANCLTAAVYPI